LSQKSDYWGPQPDDVNNVCAFVQELNAKRIVDIGGRASHTFPLATESVGWEGTHNIDFEFERLPYDDQSVDFVYSRHTIEDLANPQHLLSEIRRVAKAGYLETPSPQAELTRGVDAHGDHVGYVHHRWICYSRDGEFVALPKYPIVERMPLADSWYTLARGEKWNTRHFFEFPLRFKILRNEIDFDLSIADMRDVKRDYQIQLEAALEAGAK
jgi:SAM-dependent methyltransferase